MNTYRTLRRRYPDPIESASTLDLLFALLCLLFMKLVLQ